MAKILVFNNDTNRMETYYRGENTNTYLVKSSILK